MSKERFRSSYDAGKFKIDIGLSVLIWKDSSGIYYFYTPSLDLTGYGRTEQAARQSFEHTLNDFVSYTNNKNTIFEELEKLGWTVNKKKKRVSPPSEEQLLEDNENYRQLSNNRDVKVERQQVELAL